MGTVLITEGAHWRNVHMPPLSEDRQFAHKFDPDCPEDVPHQAHNFETYASSLGGSQPPHVLIAPPSTGDPVEDQHIKVELSDWASIVQTATHKPVVIR